MGDRAFKSWQALVLGLVAGVVSALATQALIRGDSLLPQAIAQVPDGGMQRKEMIDALERNSEHLAEIVRILKTESIKVRVDSADKKGGAAVPK